MTAPDYPPGEWSELLVGFQWVSGTTVTILNHAIANRRAIVTHFTDLRNTLQKAVDTTLVQQEGETADAIRDAFRQGADQAFDTAEKNEAYADALQKAHNDVVALRYFLTDIAERGNKEINDIQNSKADVATKVAKITEAIAKYQREANQKAAACADDIMDAGEGVVTAQGGGQSFRGMAHAIGLDANKQPDLDDIERQVRSQLNAPPLQSAMGNNPLAAPGTPSGPQTIGDAGPDDGALATAPPAGVSAGAFAGGTPEPATEP